MSFDRGDQAGWQADLLARAGAAGAAAAEVFAKTARGRRLVLEPGVLKDGRPRLTISRSGEGGLALRVRGRGGGWGMSWRSPFEIGSRNAVVEEALQAAALRPPERSGAATGIPCAPPGAPLPAAADLGLFDPEILLRPETSLRPLLEEAAEAAREGCGAGGVVDAVTLSEAVLSVDLVNSAGFTGCYTRTLALLSVLTAPAAPGARGVVEERSASRLDDLDARACGLDAARRSLGTRRATPPQSSGSPPVVMLPRAVAELLVRLVPLLLAGGEGPPGRPGSHPRVRRRGPTPGPARPGMEGMLIVDDGRLRGAFGSAPFDGVGRPTSTTILSDGDRFVGRLSPDGGNVTRPSLREPPALGLSNLRLVRSGRTGEGRVGRRAGSAGPAALLDPGEGPCLLIEAARCLPGPSFRVKVVRGEWRWRGAPRAPADGLIWEGAPAGILRAVAAIGEDEAVFHPGMPVVVPSLRLEGLGAWCVGEEGARPPVRSESGVPIRPPAQPE